MYASFRAVGDGANARDFISTVSCSLFVSGEVLGVLKILAFTGGGGSDTVHKVSPQKGKKEVKLNITRTQVL